MQKLEGTRTRWYTRLLDEGLPKDLHGLGANHVGSKVLRKCKSWKAPGPDGIQGYWMKAFPKISMVLGQTMWAAIKHPSRIQDWLVRGKTVLILKEGCKGKPNQYRPITCLNVMNKLMTAIVADVLYHKETAVGAIPTEQRALIKGIRMLFT